MKKIIITSCILLGALAFNNSQAQTSAGIKGGFNFSDLSGRANNMRVSGNVGVFVHSQINSNWAIQPELLYSGQGRKYVSADHNDRTNALDYIQVPVMLQYYPTTKFYVEAGPQVGFLASSSLKNSSGDKITNTEKYSKADVAINVGAGVNATRRIGFFARYGFGLTNVIKNDPDGPYHNMVGQVGATIKLTR